MEPVLDDNRKRLRFRCHHTGMKENDLLVGSFADHYLGSLSDEDVAWFENMLLSTDDIDLNNWLMGREAVPAKLDHPVMGLLLDFVNKRS